MRIFRVMKRSIENFVLNEYFNVKIFSKWKFWNSFYFIGVIFFKTAVFVRFLGVFRGNWNSQIAKVNINACLCKGLYGYMAIIAIFYFIGLPLKTSDFKSVSLKCFIFYNFETPALFACWLAEEKSRKFKICGR